MSKFQDLVVFQRAVDLSVHIYEVTRTFPKEEMYGLTSQLRRASYGVVSNIAEGEGRLTYGERRQFLSQARGSLFEVEGQSIIAERLGFLTADAHAAIRVHVRKTGKALIGYIRWVKKMEESIAKPRNPAAAKPTTSANRSRRACPPASPLQTPPPAT